jgi:hypothetical protein
MIGLAETDSWRPLALADLSLSQLDAGQSADALVTAETALRLARKANANSYYLALPLLAHGRAALAAAHASDAEASLREAVDVRRKVYEPDDMRMIETEVALVECLRALRKYDEAAALASATMAKLQSAKTGYAVELRDRLKHPNWGGS